MDGEVARYVAERDEALLSLDEGRIKALMARYGGHVPADDEVFWAAVHKARLTLAYYGEAEHEISRRWLREHGFRPEGV